MSTPAFTISPIILVQRRSVAVSSNSERNRPPEGTPFPLAPPISIPPGAKIEPSYIGKQLGNLSFGYETLDDVRYRCANGHIVRAKIGSKACEQCPLCLHDPPRRGRGNKLSYSNVCQLAKERNGKLVSTEYVNARTPLVWQCDKGHQWKATVSNVRTGQWCPECWRQSKRLTMEDMHKMAKDRGGECLSKEYVSNSVKLKWRCAKGHEFMLAPSNMRRKEGGKKKADWCKICAREERLKELSPREGCRLGSKV